MNIQFSNVLMSLFASVLAPALVLAQGKIFSAQVGGPETVVQVINTTSATSLVDLGGKAMWVQPGSKVERGFGYGTTGNISVEVSVCSGVREGRILNPIPSWATDHSVVGDAALPANYVNPSVSALKPQVDKIKAALRDRAGGKAMQRQISDWFKRVKKQGFGSPARSCEDPTILVRTVDVSQWGYGRAVPIVVAGSREQGYSLR